MLAWGFIMSGLRRKLPVLLVSLVVLSTGSIPMFAHHGTAAFDMEAMVTFKGTVTDFQYVNPHSQVYFQTKNDKGETEQWQGELTAPTKLGRAGWSKHTLNPGDTITITGNPAKNGAHTLWIRKLIGPDGTALHLSED
jgi:hypothetical protein